MLNSVLQSNQQQMSVEAAELINCTWGWTFLIDLVALWCFGMMTESSWTNGRQQRCLFALAVWRQQFKCGSLTLEHSRKIYHSIFVCVCVWTSQTHTGGTGDGHNASLSLSQQRQEGLGDAQRAEEIDLHAPTVVGHQRQLDFSEVHTHAGVIHQSPQTCKDKPTHGRG